MSPKAPVNDRNAMIRFDPGLDAIPGMISVSQAAANLRP